jgi:hypothetical protein
LMIDVQQLRRSPKGKALWSARGIGLTNHWPIIDQSLIDFIASQQMQTWRDPAECPGTAWSMATDCILCQTLWHYIQTLFIHSLHTLSTDSLHTSSFSFSLSLFVSLFSILLMFLERTFQCAASKNIFFCCKKRNRGTRQQSDNNHSDVSTLLWTMVISLFYRMLQQILL